MDHFFVGVYLRRKVRFMAKSQLFGPPVLTYIYKHGGVFPVRRGHHDEEAFKTAYELLDQGEMLLVYAEGGRSRTRRAGRAETRDRPDRAGVRRADRPGRDPRLGRRAQLEAPALPEGDGPVRRADHLRRSRPTPSRERQLEAATEIFARVREMYDGLATRSERSSRE